MDFRQVSGFVVIERVSMTDGIEGTCRSMKGDSRGRLPNSEDESGIRFDISGVGQPQMT